MSLQSPIYQETGLVGRIVTSSVTETSTTIYAKFEDKKTGDEREPQAETLYFVLSKDTDRFEIIKADSHTTTSGVTTITVNAAGRDLNLYGTPSGDASGNKHPINSEIGCADIHLPIEVLNDIVLGTEGTSGTSLKVGNETDSDIYYYAWNADAYRPYIKYDKTTNKWYISNNGVDTYDITAGGSGVTAGDGIVITLGAVAVDTTDTNIFVNTSSGAADEDLVPTLNASGILADGFMHASLVMSDVTSSAAELNKLDGASENVTSTNLNTLTAGATSDASELHGHSTFVSISVTSGEAIDGSETPQAVCLAGETLKDILFVGNSMGTYYWPTSVSFGNDLSWGDADASTWVAQSFTYTNEAAAEAITITKLILWLQKAGNPLGSMTIEIQTDDANKPSGTVVTNGTSDAYLLSGLTTAYVPISFTFSSNPEISYNTKYWIVCKRTNVNDAANYPQISSGISSLYASHSYSTYTASTTSWSTQAALDVYFYVEFNVDMGNKIYKADANSPMRSNVIGFTIDDVAAGEALDVNLLNQIQSGFTGLTNGRTYYLSTTAGGITAAPTGASEEVAIVLGKTYSTTSLLSINSLKTIYVEVIGSSSGAMYAKEDAGGSVTFFVATGFRPVLTRLIWSYDDDAGGSENIVCSQDFIFSKEATTLALDFLAADFTVSNAVTEAVVAPYTSSSDDVVYVSALHENGVDITIKQKDTAQVLRELRLYAQGY